MPLTGLSFERWGLGQRLPRCLDSLARYGGHAREVYPNRDDTNYMRHTMAYKEGRNLLSDVRLDYKPVVQTRYEPMERKD